MNILLCSCFLVLCLAGWCTGGDVSAHGISIIGGEQRGAEVKYEAEKAFVTTDVDNTVIFCKNNLRERSSSYATVAPLSTITFTVNIPQDGVYPVTLRFASCLDELSNSSVTIHANGIHLLEDTMIASVKVSSAHSGDAGWYQKTHPLSLRAGLNTISYKVGNAVMMVDHITISGGLPLAPRGATMNYYEIEAEAATYQGSLIGPGRQYMTLPSEASGRKAVQLKTASDYVQFTLTGPASAIVIRFSIPNGPTGSAIATPLDVYVGGSRFATINITSVYSWVYGAYPFSKRPGDGSPHHFYDDVRLTFGKVLTAGTQVKLQAPSAATVVVTIDLADFYNVPAAFTPPANYLSVADFGADPSLNNNNVDAFTKAIAAVTAQGKAGLWIPTGRYFFKNQLTSINKITIRGAGPWYTELHGNDFGFIGNWAPNPSTNVQLYDFAIFGRTITRDDDEQSTAAGGALSSSVLQNLWIEHNKCGLWLDGPFNSLFITGLTIRNTFADGINFHKGVTNSVVEQTIIRNVGDDALAMWAEQPGPYSKNTFRFNTLQLPILANNIAIYGGSDNSATDNLCLDTVAEGGGLQTGTRFGSVPLGGTTTFSRNTLIRTGGPSMYDPSSKGFGQIWLYSDSQPITTPVIFEDISISDCYYQGIGFYQSTMSGITFNNITIDGADFALEERVNGAISASYVVATNIRVGGQWNCGVTFTITKGAGNSGWDSIMCKG